MISFLFSCIVFVGFWVNIPFYLRWIRRQDHSEESYLYGVKGEFCYVNVLEQLERIELATGVKLLKQRSIIESLKNTCDKRNVPLRAYKKRIHDLLKEESYGHPMIRKAFKRMPMYSKITFLWDLGIMLAIILCVIAQFSMGGVSLEIIFLGVVLGFVAACPVWIVAHKGFNEVLKYFAKKQFKKNKSYGYFQVAMAHFYGCSAGMLWSDLHWGAEPGSNYSARYGGISGGALGGIGGGVSGYGGFGGYNGFGGGGFGGGGAGGSW
jgi:hypothetical protein